MGRELRRKEAKKNGNNIKETNNNNIDTGVEKFSLIKITIVVLSLLALLYLILAIFVTKELDLSTDKEAESENEQQEKVSNAILASSTFNQSEETYYVLFYGFKDEEEMELATTVTNSVTDNKLYKVDTESGLNKNYVSDKSNPNVTSISDLKVKSPTLIKLSADKVTLYVEGIEKIEEYLSK